MFGKYLVKMAKRANMHFIRNHRHTALSARGGFGFRLSLKNLESGTSVKI